MNTEQRQTSSERTILEGRNLHKKYRLGSVDVPVLHGASIAIEEGEWVAVLGASGSGKSTLLHLLGGLDTPDADKGRVFFRGEEVRLDSGERTNRYRNESIGFVFQFYHLLPELDVLENGMLASLVSRMNNARVMMIAFACIGAGLGGWLGSMAALSWGMLPVEERTTLRAVVLGIACGVLGAAAAITIGQVIQAIRVRTMTSASPEAGATRKTIGDFGLQPRTRHRPRELSGGERQRVAIARALGSDPDVLLADEPTGNLDANTGFEILDLLKQRHENGLTIVMVTHDPKVAAYADRVVRLEDGAITNSDGEPDASRCSDAIPV